MMDKARLNEILVPLLAAGLTITTLQLIEAWAVHKHNKSAYAQLKYESDTNRQALKSAFEMLTGEDRRKINKMLKERDEFFNVVKDEM